MQGKPTMYVIAGPEGSGKTTFYEQTMVAGSKLVPELRPAYVSADKVQDQMLGDKTNRAYGAGNLIADQQARSLMGDRKSFVAETTFANDRDLKLVTDAKEAGYRVVLFQMQTKSPELSVARVAERVKEGGRDAPEAIIRADYARAPALIAQAAQKADHTYVYDTSALNQAPAHVLTLERGRVTSQARELPDWAKLQYGKELQIARDGSVSAAERSFANAIAKAEQRTPGANVQVGGYKAAEYTGPIVANTNHHVLQQTGEKQYVAHFKDRLAAIPNEKAYAGEMKISYGADRDKGRIEFAPNHGLQTDAQNKQDARDFLTKPREAAVQNPRLAAAYAVTDRLENAAWTAGPHTDKVEQRVNEVIRSSVAARLQQGKPMEISRPMVDAVNNQVASRNQEHAKEQALAAQRQLQKVTSKGLDR